MGAVIDKTDALFCWCRPGFEPELAAELTERAAQAGVPGYARTERGSGHVEFLGDGVNQPGALPTHELVFARQAVHRLAALRELDPTDRITPLREALAETAGSTRFGELWTGYPDSDTGKPLAGLARGFGNALRPVLRRDGILAPADDPRLPRLHVVFLGGRHLVLARSDSRDGARWPMGIPRLRMHPDAPSRSALKLEEALLVLLEGGERERLLREGMTAADLGAAPGGWTWVLVRNGLRVTAIDNGPLRPSLMDTGRVEHLRADGFQWQPPRTLDWLVCDMVEQPRRVAERIGTWFHEGWCRQAVFNLKLPMKKRWDETRLCLDLFTARCGRPMTVRARQLYHDREEITVFAAPR